MKEKCPGRKSAAVEYGYWIFALLFWESVLHFAVFGGFGAKFVYVAGFTVTFALVLALLVSFLKQKAAFVADLLLTALMTVLYGSQMVYYFIFGTLYSVALMGQGGQAVTSFWRETYLSHVQILPYNGYSS